MNNFQEKTNFIWSAADEVLRDDFKLIFNDYFEDFLNDMIDSNLDLYTKINDDRDFGDIFKKALFDSVYRHLTGVKKIRVKKG